MSAPPDAAHADAHNSRAQQTQQAHAHEFDGETGAASAVHADPNVSGGNHSATAVSPVAVHAHADASDTQVHADGHAHAHSHAHAHGQHAQSQSQSQSHGPQPSAGGSFAPSASNSHGHFALSQNQMLAMQQAHAAAGAQPQTPPQMYSSNKNLVEHAKNSNGQGAQDGAQSSQQQSQQSSLGHVPLHPAGVNSHYTMGNIAASSYGNSHLSPVNVSPLTASPADGSPYDGQQVAPYDGQQVAPYPGDSQHLQHYAMHRNMQHSQQQQQQQHQYSPVSPQQHAHHGNSQHGHSHGSGPANQAFAQVLVAGLPLNLTQAELGEIFSSLPSYERCGIACDPNTGVSIGRGWLVFASSDYAQQAIAKMNGMSLGGSTLQLSMMQPIGESTKSNIYVAGLPKQYTQSQLEQLFQTFGTIIESKILTDPAGVSRGVAFVRYDNSNSAAQAITAVNGHVMADGLHTWTIRVKFARDHHRNADPTLAMLTGHSPNSPPHAHAQPHAPRAAAIYQSYIPPNVKARGDEISGGIALFVFHIPAEYTSRDLQELFAPCATVLSARIAIHPQTLESKGFGFVTVSNLEEAHQAVTLLNGRRVGRKFIKVSFKKQQSATPGGGVGHGAPQNAMAPHQSHGHAHVHAHAPQQHSHHHPQQAHPQQQQQQQQQSQQHQRAPSMDINLSSLAAALTLSQSFNALNPQPLNYGNNGGWTQPASAAPASPSLINYNQQSLPLHLLMQQMQLSQYNSPQQHSQVHGQAPSAQHSNVYNFSPNGVSAPAPNNNWLPSSPINLPQSALANSGAIYAQHSNSNYYNASLSPQAQQQQQQAHPNSHPAQQHPNQQSQSQQSGAQAQHLFM